MLFRSLFRVVGKVRAGAVKGWLHGITQTYHEINMAPRRWVSDATFRLQVRRDLGVAAGGGCDTDEGRFGAEVQWDLSKAFDRVNWGNLVKRAVEWGYPLEALRLSMVSYSWQRRLVMDGVIGGKVHPRRGVAAGSPFAPYELALVTLPTIVRLRKSELPIVISVHVDDFLLAGTGKTRE